MKPFGSALGALALWLASPLCAGAAEGSVASAAGQACDVICALQAYMGRDHMVTLVPATPQAPQAAIKMVRKPVKIATRHGVTARLFRRKPGPDNHPVATGPTPPLMPRQTAQLSPPASVATLAPGAPAPAMRLPQTIPGSAPLVTPQFEAPSP